MAEEKSDIDIVLAWMQREIQDPIIKSQEDKGLKASGESAKQLRTQKDGDKIGKLIDGSGSFEFQNFGRGPGKMPLVNQIFLWLAFRKYGLDWKTEKDRTSLSWALSIKIRNRGTFTHINKKPTGVLSDNVTPEKIETLKNLIADNNKNKILTDIKRIFNAATL